MSSYGKKHLYINRPNQRLINRPNQRLIRHQKTNNETNNTISDRKTINLICDINTHKINTCFEYDISFRKYSKNNILYYDFKKNIENILNIKHGILLLSYTIIHNFLCNNSISNNKLKNFLINSKLKKIFIIQDEYYDCNHINNFISRAKPDIIYTCLNETDVKAIYGNNILNTKFNRVLTGYIESKNINKRQIKDRGVDVFYRGKKLHYYYGKLGYLKYYIGDTMREYSKRHGLNHDIDMSVEKRINGIDWYTTLLNSKVTLGTLSGSNVINVNNNLRDKINRDYNIITKSNTLDDSINYSYNETFKKYNIKEELNVGQLSPKMFEAIELGTVLVLFEGNYSNILIPDIHYISLKEDLSNIEDVMSKIKDNDFLQNMADRAFDDIVKSMKYSYETYINNFDKDIETLS
jgi:hypothetical protein